MSARHQFRQGPATREHPARPPGGLAHGPLLPPRADELAPPPPDPRRPCVQADRRAPSVRPLARTRRRASRRTASSTSPRCARPRLRAGCFPPVVSRAQNHCAHAESAATRKRVSRSKSRAATVRFALALALPVAFSNRALPRGSGQPRAVLTALLGEKFRCFSEIGFSEPFEDEQHVFPDLALFGERLVPQQVGRVIRGHQGDAVELVPAPAQAAPSAPSRRANPPSRSRRARRATRGWMISICCCKYGRQVSISAGFGLRLPDVARRHVGPAFEDIRDVNVVALASPSPR